LRSHNVKITIPDKTPDTIITNPGDSTFGLNNILGITFDGNGRFIAVGSNGRMPWSDDGITWNAITAAQSTFGANVIIGITYGNDKFVAVGNSGRMAWANWP
jgi:hypothetical protein